MKKLILLSAFVLIGLTSFAQFGKPVKMALAVGDTAKNTTQVNKIITATAGYGAIGIQPIITKQSGTIAGKCYLYESLDGTNYIKTDSLALTDQTTNTTIWTKQTTPYGYYKINVTGSGTMQGLLSVWYVLRKYQTQQ